jgi:hypothetical protein
MDNLATFDHFRDRLLQAIEEAGGDLAKLKGLGDTWSAGHGEIGEAWNQLSQRLELVRLHLAHEADVAKGEFETERLALAAHLEEIRLAAEKPHSRGELVGTVGREFAKFLPALKTFFLPSPCPNRRMEYSDRWCVADRECCARCDDNHCYLHGSRLSNSGLR